MSQLRGKRNEAGSSSQGVDSKKEKGTGKKSKASLGQEDGSDDEYQGGSQVGAASQGQSNREWNALSSDDKKMSVNKIVNFMLARDADKIPAKRSDITDHLRRGKGKISNAITSILIDEAKKVFEHVFGFEFVEQNTYAIVDEVLSQAASSQSRASSKVYMLTNVLKPPPEQQQELQSRKGPHADDDDDDEGRHGFKRKRADMLDLGTSCNLAPRFDLAMVLMGVVALQRFKVEESVMWDKFRALGLVKGRFHPIFGLPENALRDLCSQGYLHQKKSKDADNQLQTHYCLGLRAESEVGRREILTFVENTFGERMNTATKKSLLDEDVESGDEH